MRTGIDAQTGKVLTGWDHCVQSLGKLFTTRVNSRIMRRHLGADVPGLQDANANGRTLMELYVAIAEAVEDPDDGEPGFRLRGIQLQKYGRDGKFAIVLNGEWYPRGHLGDFSIREENKAIIPVSTGKVLVLEAA